MRRLHGAHRGIAIALIAVTAAICIAACGGSSNNSSANTSKTTAKSSTTTSSTTTPTTTTGAASRFTALSACLKKHGVKLPSRTGSFHRGGGFFGGQGTGTTRTAPPTGTGTRPTGGFFGGSSNSKLAKAFKACGGFGAGGGFAGGGFRGGAGTVHRPTFSKATLDKFVTCVRTHGYPQMPEPSSKASATGALFPASVETNAKFKAASVKCESILTAGFKRPPGGTPGANPPTA